MKVLQYKAVLTRAVTAIVLIATIVLISCRTSTVDYDRTDTELLEEQIMEDNKAILDSNLPDLDDDIIDLTVGVISRCDMGKIIEVEIIEETSSGYRIRVQNDLEVNYFMVINQYGVTLITKDSPDGEIIWAVRM